MNIMFETFVGGSCPPISGYIFTTPYFSSKLYLAIRPTGPANDWSQTIAYQQIKSQVYC